MSRPRITPRTLKGFRDYLPAVAIPREEMVATAKNVFRSFGFAPIDTPALEYTEILLGKGGEESDKQLYRFLDNGGRDVALRFDLTVPLARFMAQHSGELGTPFRRYHVGPVWRGENPQAGRYREFLQCDFDVIGTESPLADAEIALVIHALFVALGFERFKIRLNDRRVLNGLLERLELSAKSEDVLRALDKLAKVGPEKVAEEMAATAGASAAQAEEVLRMAALGGTNDEILAALGPLVGESEVGARGVAALGELVEAAEAGGVVAGRLALDVSIARGLDYYTGPIYETFLDDLPGIGSCCSGGRYDDLASLYTKERLPGVGASLGLDRLVKAMEDLGLLEARAASAPVFVPLFEASRKLDYLRLAAELRAAGIPVEVYPEPRKLGAQLKYADRRGYSLALVIGGNEWEAGVAQVKDLATKETAEVPLASLAEDLRARLDRAGRADDSGQAAR